MRLKHAVATPLAARHHETPHRRVAQLDVAVRTKLGGCRGLLVLEAALARPRAVGLGEAALQLRPRAERAALLALDLVRVRVRVRVGLGLG